jgi:hypothetical protein
MDNSYKSIIGKHEGKRPLGRNWHMQVYRRLYDDIKLNLRGIGHAQFYRFNLIQGGDQWQALVNTVTNRHVA